MRDLRLEIGDHALLAVLVNRRFQIPAATRVFDSAPSAATPGRLRCACRRTRPVPRMHRARGPVRNRRPRARRDLSLPASVAATACCRLLSSTIAANCGTPLRYALNTRLRMRRRRRIRASRGPARCARRSAFARCHAPPGTAGYAGSTHKRAGRTRTQAAARGFRLDDSQTQSAADQRAGQAAADQAASDNGDIDFHLTSLHVRQRVDSYADIALTMQGAVSNLALPVGGGETVRSLTADRPGPESCRDVRNAWLPPLPPQ